jgi:hypothetical protein
MSIYPLALFAHIVGVLGLFIAIGLQWTITVRLRRARSLATVREWTSLVGGLFRLVPASGALIMLAGMYMAAIAWNMTTPWIMVGFLMLLFLVALQFGVTLRRLRAIRRSAVELQFATSSIPEGLQHQIDDPLLWTAVQVLGTTAVGVVFLMTVKPDLAGSLLVLAVAVALGAFSAQLWRRPRAARLPAPEAQVG